MLCFGPWTSCIPSSSFYNPDQNAPSVQHHFLCRSKRRISILADPEWHARFRSGVAKSSSSVAQSHQSIKAQKDTQEYLKYKKTSWITSFFLYLYSGILTYCLNINIGFILTPGPSLTNSAYMFLKSERNNETATTHRCKFLGRYDEFEWANSLPKKAYNWVVVYRKYIVICMNSKDRFNECPSTFNKRKMNVAPKRHISGFRSAGWVYLLEIINREAHQVAHVIFPRKETRSPSHAVGGSPLESIDSNLILCR